MAHKLFGLVVMVLAITITAMAQQRPTKRVLTLDAAKRMTPSLWR